VTRAKSARVVDGSRSGLAGAKPPYLYVGGSRRANGDGRPKGIHRLPRFHRFGPRNLRKSAKSADKMQLSDSRRKSLSSKTLSACIGVHPRLTGRSR